MGEIPLYRLGARVNLIADRTALHRDDRLVTVLPFGRCSQSVNKFLVEFTEYFLEGERRDMMTFVYYHHTVIFDKPYYLVAADNRLYIFDHGYPSEKLIRRLSNHLHYLMRVRAKFSKKIDELPLGSHVITMYGDIRARIFMFKLPSGEVEMLISNLFDLPDEEFKPLYFKRWGIEIKYDVVKNKPELPNFNGFTAKEKPRTNASRSPGFIHSVWLSFFVENSILPLRQCCGLFLLVMNDRLCGNVGLTSAHCFLFIRFSPS